MSFFVVWNNFSLNFVQMIYVILYYRGTWIFSTFYIHFFVVSIKFRSKRNGNSGHRASLYSIQINPRDTSRADHLEYEDNLESHLSAPQLSPRPMTPRRVKRRSVISRGTTATSSLPHCHDKRSSVRWVLCN